MAIVNKYNVNVVVEGNVGGTVKASTTGTDEAGTVTLDVTPNAQTETELPYVLESLTVKGPKDESPVDIKDKKSFELTDEGSYTVTAKFVQPITKADFAVVDNKADLETFLVGGGYRENLDGLFTEGQNDEYISATMKKEPWLIIGTKLADENTKILSNSLTYTQNGVKASSASITTPDFNKFLSVIVNDPEGSDPDALNFANAYGTYEVSFTYEGAEYSFTTEYAPEGTVKATYQDSKSDEVYATHVGKTEDKLTPPTVTKDGYTFTGWNSQADGSGDPLTPDTTTYENGTTWYAQWKADEYTVTYNRENGDWVEGFEPTTTYTIESETIALPTAADITRDGYTSAGWKNEQGETVTEIPTGSTGHITLTAQWTADAATVEEMEELLKNALTTQWEDDFTYTHEAEIAGTTVDSGAYPNEFVDAKEEEGHTIATADLARFLGGIHQSMDPTVQESASITYGKDTYNWNADKGNAGSNWYKDDTSLVSALTLDIAEDLGMDLPIPRHQLQGLNLLLFSPSMVLTLHSISTSLSQPQL